MKKILKQIDYANEILKNGFTKNYRSEWYYLTKLLKMLGYKRSEAKIKLTEYLVDYYKNTYKTSDNYEKSMMKNPIFVYRLIQLINSTNTGMISMS